MTVTAVELSRDLSHAKVFFLPFDGKRAATEVAAALGSAAGFLRVHLKKHLRIRSAPELHFIPDESIERGARLSALINAAVASDAGHADRGPGEPTDGDPGDEQTP